MEKLIKENIFLREILLNSETENSSSSSSESYVSLILSEDSSSEDDIKCKRIRISNYIEDTVLSYSVAEFKSHFRMQKATAYKIIDVLSRTDYHPKYSKGRENITAEKAFLLTLWYLGNQETLRQISDRFNITESSVCRVLTRIINFLLSISKTYITWPSQNKAQAISEAFAKKRGIQGVLGAIDGTHIPIKRPDANEECYLNRKGYHSIILQGVVDHQKKFIDCFCGEAGSQHDARVLRKSSLYRRAEEANLFHNKYFLLGDSAYPSKNWLVPPFRDNGHLTRNQKDFNFMHSSTRIVIEHSFGLLKDRFRRLFKFENRRISFIVKCVVAACVLHNICIEEGDEIELNVHNVDNEDDEYCDEACNNDRRADLFRNMFGIN